MSGHRYSIFIVFREKGYLSELTGKARYAVSN